MSSILEYLLTSFVLFIKFVNSNLATMSFEVSGTEFTHKFRSACIYIFLIFYLSLFQEVLAVYLQHYPDSAIALNLKACDHFRLYNGKAAESELKNLQEMSSSSFTFASELIKHNLVRFYSNDMDLSYAFNYHIYLLFLV